MVACFTGCGRSGIGAFDDSSDDDDAARSGSGGVAVTGGSSSGGRSSGGSGSGSGSGGGGQGGSAGSPGGASSLGGAGAGAAGSAGLGGQAGEAPCPTLEPGADRESPWSFQFGDDQFQQGTNVVAAPDGSSYVAGAFEGALDVGSGLWEAETGGDAFVARFAPAGRILFALRFQAFTTRVRAMTLTSEGILVVVGSFSGTVDFGGTSLVARGTQSAFLLEIDACGHVLHARSFGEESSVAMLDAVTAIGDGYAVGGSFVGAVDVGVGRWEISGFEPEAFVARYRRGSEPVWARHLAGVRRVVLTADDDKSVYIAGAVAGVLDLEAAGSFSGPGRAFAAKLDARGTPRWAVLDQGDRSGGEGRSSAQALTIDSAGNVIVLVDLIYASLDFGEGAKGDYVCCGNDEYALSLHPDGVPLRLTLVDHYVTIRIAGTSTGFVAVTHDASAHGFDVSRYDEYGLLVGSRNFGFRSYVNVFAVAVDDADSMIVTGNFRGQLDIGSGPLEETQGFDWDGFVGRLPANALE